MGAMVRTPLTPEERERGERLGRLLREARGDRSMPEVAARAGVSAETLRKIETGRAPPPPSSPWPRWRPPSGCPWTS